MPIIQIRTRTEQKRNTCLRNSSLPTPICKLQFLYVQGNTDLGVTKLFVQRSTNLFIIIANMFTFLEVDYQERLCIYCHLLFLPKDTHLLMI